MPTCLFSSPRTCGVNFSLQLVDLHSRATKHIIRNTVPKIELKDFFLHKNGKMKAYHKVSREVECALELDCCRS